MELKIRDMSALELEELSRSNTFSLTLEEMAAVKKYFTEKKKDPTRLELECIAQTWSEHCNHKTMTGRIDYTENGKKE